MRAPLIIGGGPAGAAAATLLATAGQPVTLVERHAGPVDKLCGGFLSGAAIDALRALGLDPLALGGAPIRTIRLVSRTTIAEAALPFPAMGLSRRILDEALLRLAADRGATVLCGQTVRGLVRTSSGFTVNTATAGPLSADTVFLATGKHDLRGLRRPVRAPELLGLEMYYDLKPDQHAALHGCIELLLLRGGYAGLQLVGSTRPSAPDRPCEDGRDMPHGHSDKAHKPRERKKAKKTPPPLVGGGWGEGKSPPPSSSFLPPYPDAHDVDPGHNGMVRSSAQRTHDRHHRAVLCLLLPAERFRQADADWDSLLDSLMQDAPLLARRLAGATPCLPRPLAIAATPYGHLHRHAPAAPPNLFRLGDQACVVPSLAGDGIATALHSAMAATSVWLNGGDAADYHARFASDASVPLRFASLIHAACRTPALQPVIAAACRAWPPALGIAASLSRVARPA